MQIFVVIIKRNNITHFLYLLVNVTYNQTNSRYAVEGKAEKIYRIFALVNHVCIEHIYFASYCVFCFDYFITITLWKYIFIMINIQL